MQKIVSGTSICLRQPPVGRRARTDCQASRRHGAVLITARLFVLDGRRVWAYGRWRTPGAKGDPVYPGTHAHDRADQAAFVMASTGKSVSYAEYEARTNRLAHLLRSRGLGRLDHYAIFMENNDRSLEACGAGERAGLYYTCVNSYLTAPELAYILNNSTSKFLITSGRAGRWPWRRRATARDCRPG